jgi:hypothetical protein
MSWYNRYSVKRELLPRDVGRFPHVDVASLTRPHDVSDWAVARRLCVVMGWPWMPPVQAYPRGKRISEGGDARAA